VCNDDYLTVSFPIVFLFYFKSFTSTQFFIFTQFIFNILDTVFPSTEVELKLDKKTTRSDREVSKKEFQF
jgi:hypothetical protein